MKLLALVLLLSAFSSLTLTEVVKSFSETCPLLFIKDSEDKIVTPTVLKGDEYKQICQRWKNMYRFATLYDTKQRIPVYSAFIFTDQNNKRNGEWKNEPQLENLSYTADMKEITVAEMDEYYNQAVNRDYTESQADSTFTFTNVAPQTQHSNGEWAKEVEIKIKTDIKTKCKPNVNTNVVTGVIPGENWISIKRKNETKGINIPKYFWTAYCCINGKNERISKAYLFLINEQNKKTYELTEMSVDRMNYHLKNFYNQDFTIFGDLCLT
ncbi:endonuclease domain-containing 1 protein-like isoform X1 [Silurus meridionalis]|uniref:endonuclease domain-containing 1 protein-like isoform X1 n=1 Tax=Silurus meridionalis TaxID=175797 RepID=UPI001EEBB499|nr:endonuclease domain-containing 1 protein-like isoform X1 [Silurus meridionalis]